MEETNRVSEEELEGDSVGKTGSTGNQIRDTKMSRTGSKSTSKPKQRSSKTAELEMKLFSIEKALKSGLINFLACFRQLIKEQMVLILVDQPRRRTMLREWITTLYRGSVTSTLILHATIKLIDKLRFFKDDLPGDISDESVEENRSCFPVHEKSLPVLQVPSLDDMLEPMIKRVHGNKTVKSWDKQKQLFSQTVKQIEKLSYSGQVASRMGIIFISYMQLALGTLLGNLENGNASEENFQLMKDLFAMSTKSLDQIGRAGAFHHMIRRKCAATDAGINNFNDIQAKILYRPLKMRSGFGIKTRKTKMPRHQTVVQVPVFFFVSPGNSPADSEIQLCASVQHLPTSLYKNSVRSGSLLENEKYKISSISGRLVNDKPTKSTSVSRSSRMSQSLGITRVHSGQRKIQTSSESEIDLLWGAFDQEKGLIFSTQEQIDKLNLAIKKIVKEIQVTALDFLHLLWIMASCIELIPNARLYMRAIQLHLLSFWRPACQEFKTQVLVTQHLKSHPIGWLNSANTLKGHSLQLQQTCITITTDASKTGYGV
ncbi:unnamed protein product [Mytilus coruscus]|uniref:Uncharacterized protein n=1 Tax=Mytilus coruscus TaxID=42192 RepID=A0A6J8DFC0_MYTCO|nr:unnamed protein product [Mytilus coruscus]